MTAYDNEESVTRRTIGLTRINMTITRKITNTPTTITMTMTRLTPPVTARMVPKSFPLSRWERVGVRVRSMKGLGFDV